METDDIRASDTERDDAVERLREACAEGRLTLEELSERTEAVFTARTRAQLARVVRDLPERPSAEVVDASGGTAEAPRLFALGDDLERGGRWVVDDGLTATAVLGHIKLDLRESFFVSPTVTLHLRTVLGSIMVWVPPGIGVELHGTAYLGDRSVETVPARPGSPVVKIHATAMPGSIRISNNRRRGRIMRALLGE
ncbi:DUF1707 domain-containing protein [Streptomonospora nanhaiensis]|uniref:Transcriptional regulator with XRE-family HTH domain n=1 Tax=Streptomonospora nanhaiensis TaxID=1323731 RepID=A0A853BIV0_9ACTN|nr:DUF1707 domain-containing protein [Streptomonospora nanhaiensis]MBX9391084.1 DUF1707 domain-containing protein [Streptomonospora nanhaiensis]NYI95203.1 transcriptional regulator with XRE-family HTH domain [Streptomonospora nanhaiensis]